MKIFIFIICSIIASSTVTVAVAGMKAWTSIARLEVKVTSLERTSSKLEKAVERLNESLICR